MVVGVVRRGMSTGGGGAAHYAVARDEFRSEAAALAHSASVRSLGQHHLHAPVAPMPAQFLQPATTLTTAASYQNRINNQQR